MAAAGRTLVEAYPGRFVLGIGVSHGPLVDARGHRYQQPLDKMRSYLDAMDAAPGRDHRCQRSRRACWRRWAPACWNWPRNDPPARCCITERRRQPPPPGRCSALLLEENPAEARRIAREFLALYLTLPNYLRAWDRAGLGSEDQAEGGSDRLVDAVVAWGGPEVIAEQVRAHLDAGADHVCVQVLDPDPNGLPMASWRALAPALLER